MNDTVFRSKSEPSTQTETPYKTGDGMSTHIPDTEVPFTDYQKGNNHPFLVDYFKLGDTWQDKFGGFEKEINSIEGYFRGKIEQGELKNETSAVKEQMKRIYKLCEIDKTERTTMQIEKLAAYIEFLRKTDSIKLNREKYAYSQ
jgi:hypothetical protein